MRVHVGSVTTRENQYLEVEVEVQVRGKRLGGMLSLEFNGEPLAGSNDWYDWMSESLCDVLTACELDEVHAQVKEKI